jgi:hypothetical protein
MSDPVAEAQAVLVKAKVLVTGARRRMERFQ